MTTASPILFLDIDGVGNKHRPFPNGYNGMDWDNVQQLNRVLAATRCKIVVTSAWRYNVHGHSMTLSGLVNLFLSHGIDCYDGVVIGITRRDISAEVTDRGDQIKEWLDRWTDRDGRRYAVVDDGGKNKDGTFNNLGIRDDEHPVVWTDGTKGMTEVDADRLIELLGRAAP